MTDLSPGTRIKALDWPEAVSSESDASIGGIAETSYTVGSPEVAARFTAPTSGRVGVAVSGAIRTNLTSVDRIYLSFRVFAGDPEDNNLLETEDVKRGISNYAHMREGYQYKSQMTMVDGLTPGSSYYIQLRYRTTLGDAEADIAHRRVSVIPLP